MKEKAIITGDIIASTRFPENKRILIIKDLHKVFKDLKKSKTIDVIGDFEMYRGDGFQGGIAKPEHSLRVALIIKCTLKQSVIDNRISGKDIFTRNKIVFRHNNIPDARIAIGIGATETIRNKISISDGDAFRMSGRLLDSMKNSGIMIVTGIDEIDKELDVYCSLLDILIDKWSPYQANYVFNKLWDPNITDSELADQMDISQPALSQRRKTAGWDAVNKTVERFENIIRNIF